MPDISLPAPVFLDCEKGSSLALYRYAVPSSPHLPVVLTHGTFSNARICSRLAAFLREAGFDCWI